VLGRPGNGGLRYSASWKFLANGKNTKTEKMSSAGAISR